MPRPPGVPLPLGLPDRATRPAEVAARVRSLRPEWAVALGVGFAAALGVLGLVLVAGVVLLAPPASVLPATADRVGGGVLDAGRVEARPDGDAVGWIVVDVEGAVGRPGLLRVPLDVRVGDAIAAAGGFGPRADLGAVAATLNLAAVLQDGEKVVVPWLGQAASTALTGGSAEKATTSGRVDLNRATQAELEALPGIGPVTAGRILAARQESPFGSVDDLRTRGLVGASVFEDIRELVAAGG